jgi:hypothetical protein
MGGRRRRRGTVNGGAVGGLPRDDAVPAPAECGNSGKEIGDGGDRARECRELSRRPPWEVP